MAKVIHVAIPFELDPRELPHFLPGIAGWYSVDGTHAVAPQCYDLLPLDELLHISSIDGVHLCRIGSTCSKLSGGPLDRRDLPVEMVAHRENDLCMSRPVI